MIHVVFTFRKYAVNPSKMMMFIKLMANEGIELHMQLKIIFINN